MVLWLFSIVLLTTPYRVCADEEQTNHRINDHCLRCHAMSTLAYRDRQTGDIIHLFIDSQSLAQSVHGELACTKCHHEDYQHYPHDQQLQAEQLACLSCHEDDPERTPYHFDLIAQQFEQSIHATSEKAREEQVNCHSCHNPHEFKVSKVGKDIAAIVQDDNRVCLSCHEEVTDPGQNLHSWLPNREVHWQSVRCVDCHTPMVSAQMADDTTQDASARVSHQILAAEDSNVACVNCHSSDQQLLNRLYAYRSEEDLNRSGLIAKAIFNEAYIIGMSRNSMIDRIALLILFVTAIALLGHAYGRYRAYRRLQGEHKQ
jgi:predicted CXXCH cytochrome family protein